MFCNDPGSAPRIDLTFGGSPFHRTADVLSSQAAGYFWIPHLYGVSNTQVVNYIFAEMSIKMHRFLMYTCFLGVLDRKSGSILKWNRPFSVYGSDPCCYSANAVKESIRPPHVLMPSCSKPYSPKVNSHRKGTSPASFFSCSATSPMRSPIPARRPPQ